MKITVEKGLDAKQAICYVESFLKEKFAEFPLLKSNLNIYISLCDEDGNTIKDVQNEFLITEKELGEYVVQDIKEEKVKKAKEKIFSLWEEYVFFQNTKVKDLEGEILLDKTYLHNAEKRKRKQENVNNRKKQLKERESLLLKERENLERLERLLKALENGRYTLYQKTFKNPKKGYKEEIAINIVFNKNVLGEVVFFNGYEVKKGYPKSNRNKK